MSLGYAVFRLGLKVIENSDDWFDSDGRLKYKEKILFNTLLGTGMLKDAEFVAIFTLRSDAVEFCQGAGFDENSDYFYFCTKSYYKTDVDMGEYVEVGY
nr:MAG TPA: hypothetical protein [Caudoviricetes sp.]